MTTTFTATELIPWSNFNEYEGVMKGLLEGAGEVWAYVQLYNAPGSQWSEFPLHKPLPVEATFTRTTRSHYPERQSAETTHSLYLVNDTHAPDHIPTYELTARISKVHENNEYTNFTQPYLYEIDAPFTILIDMDYGVHELSQTTPPVFMVGENVRVTGNFTLSFDLDD